MKAELLSEETRTSERFLKSGAKSLSRNVFIYFVGAMPKNIALTLRKINY